MVVCDFASIGSNFFAKMLKEAFFGGVMCVSQCISDDQCVIEVLNLQLSACNDVPWLFARVYHNTFKRYHDFAYVCSHDEH